MDQRGILKYNLVNVSGEDIDLTLTDHNDQQYTFVFEKDETIYGVLLKTLITMRDSDPNIFRFVRIDVIYKSMKEQNGAVNWRKEGF